MGEFAWSLSGSSASDTPFSQGVVTSLYGLMLTTVGESDPINGAIPPGDLLLVNGELVFDDGIEQARQEIECRSGFFLGEYFLDVRQGVPYYRDVLVKDPNRETVVSTFRNIALSVPGIIDVFDEEYEYDPAARTAAVSYQARWADGQPVPISFPLILAPQGLES